ncbi:unnamed protein product [Closterium sp. Yama58-4]|nr:unnamed protein product [Closterium sp. Yama58-4]
MDDSSVRLSLRHGASVAEISKRLESFFGNLEASISRPVGSTTAVRSNTRGSKPSTETTTQADAAPTKIHTPSAACERSSLRRGVACVVNAAGESEGGGAVGVLRIRKVEVVAEADFRTAAELRIQAPPLAELRTVPAAVGELRTDDALRAPGDLVTDATVTGTRIALAPELSCPHLSDLYEVGRELGRGHFGVVRLCEDRATGERFACKTILLSGVRRRSDLMELRAEVLSLLRLQEGEGERGGKEQGGGERGRGECGAGSADGEREELAFVRLYEVVVETRTALHLILEYCPGGDLFDLVIRQKRLTEAQAAAVFRCVVPATICSTSL